MRIENKTEVIKFRDEKSEAAYKERYKEAEEAAENFETLYIDMMLKGMRETAKPEEDSNANDVFHGMLDGEYSKLMAKTQSIGIKDIILSWMKENDPVLNSNLKVLKDPLKLNKSSSELSATLENLKNESYNSKVATNAYRTGSSTLIK